MPQAVAAVATFIASALTTAGVAAGVAKAIAAIVVQIAISAAVNAAVTALTPAPDPGARLLDPSQFNQISADPLSDRVIVYGETGNAGEIIFQQLMANREDVNYVLALADAGQVLPHELTKVLMDGEERTFDGSGHDSELGAKLQVRFHGGTPDQVADAQLITDSGGIWTSAHRGRSCVYAVMRVKVADGDAFPNGRPNPMFIFKGRRVYDPRLDSTKPGGSGSHRIDDESTWEWSDNAALCAYDFARGIYIVDDDDVPRRVAGLGLPSDLIDEDWIIASANACDEMGWTINGPILAGSDPSDVLKSFAVHMGGRIATRKGKLAVIAGYDWPSSITIGENDLAGRIRIRHAKNWRDVQNAVKGTYRDKEANYEAVETNLIRVDAWIEQDNGEVFERTVTLPYCHDRELSTRLAKLDLYKKRAPRTIWAPVKLRCARAIEGDFVEVELPSHGISETYEVVSWTLDQLGFATLELELWDASGLDWSSEEAGDPPDWPSMGRLDMTPATPDADDWLATGATVTKVGTVLPVLDISGTPPSWITEICFDYRVAGDSIWQNWAPSTVLNPDARILGVLPNEDYEVGVRYRFRDKYSPRLILEVTSPDSYIVQAIYNQGDLATRDSITYRQPSAPSGAIAGELWADTDDSARGVYRFNGATWDYVCDQTAFNTAAAITGQGALATQSSANWATQVASRPTELTDGRISAGLDASGDLARNIPTTRRDSSNLLGRTGGGLFSGELAADVTATHTASAITGQGSLATLSAVTQSVLAAGVGKNCVIDGEFRQSSGNWTHGATAGSVVLAVSTGGTNVRYRQLTGSGVTVGQLVYQNSMVATAMPCQPGDKIEASAFFGATNVSSILVRVAFYDSAGAYVSEIDTISGGFNPSGFAGGGDLTTYTRRGGFATAPAGAKSCAIFCYYISSTTAPVARLALPYLGLAGSNQTQLTPWNAGFEAVPGADVTSANTAAAITSQSAWATYASHTPTGALAYMSTTGRINDWRGAPTNGLGGSGIARSGGSVAGGGSTGVSFNAVTLYVPGQGSISLPSGSVTGLSTTTKYWAFYRVPNNDYIVTSTFATAAGYMNDASGAYVYVGSRTTGGGSVDQVGVGETP